jgi:hypothetical protein
MRRSKKQNCDLIMLVARGKTQGNPQGHGKKEDMQVAVRDTITTVVLVELLV